MRKQALISVAALLASASLATAQQPPNGAAGAGKMDAPAASDKAPGQMKEPGTSAKDQAPGQMKEPGASAKDEAPGQTKKSNDPADAPGQAKSSDKTGDTTEDKKADRDGMKNDDRVGDKPDRDGMKKEGRVGDEGASKGEKGSIKNVTTEQRTKVTTTFSRHRVEPARNINFSINVGVSVPRDVRFYAIPEDIVIIVPEYRYYRYFIVDNKVIIVDPDTYEIVDIIIIA